MLHGSHARLAIVPLRVHLVTVRRTVRHPFRKEDEPVTGPVRPADGLSPLRVLEEKREQLTPKRPE